MSSALVKFKRKKLSVERIEELFNQGFSISAIADKLNYSPSRIITFARENGLSLKRPARYLEIAELIDSGMSRQAVANQLGISPSTVKRHVNRAKEYKRKLLNPAQHMLPKLEPEIAKWLMEQVPEQASLTDILTAIVTDAYFEESEK